jgi:predicted N-acetyltransferase YhbS
VRVRVATAYDEQPVLDVLRADGDATGRQPSKARLAAVRATLRSPASLTLVADDAGEVVGVLRAELADDDPGRLRLGLLCVTPERRRTGIARALVRALLDRFGSVAAWTADEAVTALLVGEGFVPSGRTGEDTASELVRRPS